jgi:uncharacterized protein (TIGR00730 family)
VGFGIALPHAQRQNPYLDLSHTFNHFYVRKVYFVKSAEGFIVLPGGFGTLDETFEALTLIQTQKLPGFPVALIDTGHWAGLLAWLRSELIRDEMISDDDLDLLHIVDDPDEAVDLLVDRFERRSSPA